jgi:hypothetical protein
MLRAESFRRFGYDPEVAFTGFPDEYGFSGRVCDKVWRSSPASQACGQADNYVSDNPN